jgi:hypothetical protein
MSAGDDDADGDGGGDGSPPPFPASLCHGCRFLRMNGSKRGSTFLMCTEGSRPKYGPQPVLACAVRRGAQRGDEAADVKAT